MRLGPVLSCSLSLFVVGCAGARARFGDVARFSPEVDGYVAGSGDDARVLRDPITATKIRCAPDLERALPAIVASLEDDAHDARLRDRARAAFFPLTAIGEAGVQVGVGMFGAPVGLLLLFLGPSRRSLYRDARRAYLDHEYAKAREGFSAVLYAIDADDPYAPLPPRFVDLSLYYLGVCDEQLHRDGEAIEAFTRFVSEGSWRGADEYRDAEARLARVAPSRLPSCASRADVRLAWRTP